MLLFQEWPILGGGAEMRQRCTSLQEMWH